jgi:precorrin-6A/cobalt-precorrin-6A reductase
VPRVRLLRAPFPRSAEDRFVPVADMAAAARALPQGARVFVAAGRRELAHFAARPDLWCLVRMIEAPPAGERLPNGEIIFGRPPADPQAEVALLEAHRIGWVVSKDSGGGAGAKIVAARRLGLPVVLVERPPQPSGPAVASVDDAIAWLSATLFGGASAPNEKTGRVS